MKQPSADIIQDAERFVRKCRQSKRAWERGNNSGDPAILAKEDARHLRLAEDAESIAFSYGCRCTWPGLWPVLERAEGDSTYGEYSTSDPARVARFFAEAQEAKS